MGFLGRKKKPEKPSRRTHSDRLKSAGTREYEAKRHDRAAERLDAAGDASGAERERGLAAEARRDPNAR